MSLLKFIKALINEFTFWLTGSVFGVAYYLASLKDWFPRVEDQYAYYYVILLFFISAYSAWRKEYLQKLQAEQKLANPVDFELTYSIIKIDFGHEMLEVHQSDYDSAHSLLQHWESVKKYPDLYEKTIKEARLPTEEDCHRYLSELETFKKEAAAFLEKVEDCYVVDFFFKNTGSAFDEMITVHVSPKEKANEKAVRIFKDFDDLCPIPVKPILYKDLFHVTTFRQFTALAYHFHEAKEDTLRNHPLILSNSISIEHNDLLAQTGRGLLQNPCIMKTKADQIMFKYEAVSKNAKDWVKREVAVDFKNAPITWYEAEEDESPPKQ